MGKMLLGFVGGIAAIGLAAPATAGTPEDPFVGVPNAKGALGTFGGSGQGGADHFGRSGRGSSGSGGGVWVNGGEWARYNNPAWRSDGFNDWWHDRPDRAYPAWMRNNQNCQRQWYAGNVLRC